MALEDVLAGLPVRGEYLAQQQFDQRQAIGLLGMLRDQQQMQLRRDEERRIQEMQPLRMELLRAQVARQNEDTRLRTELDQRQKDALLSMEGFLRAKYPGTPAQMDAADNVMTPEKQAPEVGLFKAVAALDPRNATDLALSLTGMKQANGGVPPMLARLREDHAELVRRATEARASGNNALADNLERYAALTLQRMEYEAGGQERFNRTENRRDADLHDRTGVVPQGTPRPTQVATAPTAAAQTPTVTPYTSQADSSLDGAMAATMDRLARARSAGDQEGVSRETQNIAKLRALASGQPQPSSGPSLAPKDIREIERDAIKTGNKEVFDSISKRYETLVDAPNQIAMLNKARALIPEAAPFVGPFGDTKANIVSFLNTNLGTSIAPEQVANAGALRTALFTQIMDNLKKMDAQPSQLQQQIMMRALGDLNTDPGAMNKIVDIMDEVIRTKVDTHNKRIPAGLPRGDVFKIELPSRVAAPTSSGGIARPHTQEEYDKLPRGTRYMHPDGKERTKQ